MATKKKVKNIYTVTFDQPGPTPGSKVQPFTCNASSAQSAVRKAVKWFAKYYNNQWKPNFNKAVVELH